MRMHLLSALLAVGLCPLLASADAPLIAWVKEGGSRCADCDGRAPRATLPAHLSSSVRATPPPTHHHHCTLPRRLTNSFVGERVRTDFMTRVEINKAFGLASGVAGAATVHAFVFEDVSEE